MAVIKKKQINQPDLPGIKKDQSEHDALVRIGAHWLKNTARCRVIAKELKTSTKYGEIADLLGFTHCTSFMIECKTSRSDFIADKKKIFRLKPEFGMGQYRFILCPKGLIQADEIYDGWGLLWTDGKRIYQQNCCIKFGCNITGAKKFQCSLTSERAMLYSMLLRMNNYNHVENDGKKVEMKGDE